ncbi:MAG: glycosyltransferase family 2 protein [Sphingomicrobium sp.]
MDATAIADSTVTVVIVNYRTPLLAIDCLASLLPEKRRLPKLRAVVVDGGSGGDSADQISAAVSGQDYAGWASALPLAINGGFGWANNQAILKLAQEAQPPDYVYLLNPDAQVVEGAVAALIEELRRHPECGAVGSLVLRPNRSPAASAFRFPSPGRELAGGADSEKIGKLLGIAATVVAPGRSSAVDWVSGASVMFRADALRSSGLFDDGFFLYFEEVELLHRLTRHGWTVRHVPDSKVIHIEGASTGMGSSAPTLPPYWFDSRERYFGLTGGRAVLAAANIGRFIGRAIRTAKDLGRFSRRQSDRPDVRRGSWPQRVNASFPRWGDAPGEPPAWMAER